jgi:hypothetical protein
MHHMRRLAVMLFAASLLAVWSSPACAADNAFKEVFEDGLYGGLAGALVGAALLAFTKKPGDHLDYVYYGGAGGVLVGAAYGLAKGARSLAEVENGTVKFALPTIMPDFQEASVRGGQIVAFKAELIRGKF